MKTLPMDDLHPIEREGVLLCDEMSRAIAAGESGWRQVLAAHGITGEAADAILVAVHASCRTMQGCERRRFRDAETVASQILLDILFGIRLVRKGLVGR